MNYKISWSQNYNTWANYSERMLEIQVEMSNFKEAKEVLARVMSL